MNKLIVGNLGKVYERVEMYSRKDIKLQFFDHFSNDISDQIKNNFTDISTALPPPDVTVLPRFLLVLEVVTLGRLDVYKALLQLKINKASPPGSLSKRLLKEFTFEISEPLT